VIPLGFVLAPLNEYDYPSKEELIEFFEKFGPSGVLHTWANDPTEITMGKDWQAKN
jgi:hypothetical protein